MIRKVLAITAISASLFVCPAGAVMQSGWSMSTSYVWRLLDSADNTFTVGSPAKILQADRTVMHRQAVFKVIRSITNKYTFKTGCMYQSATPAFELDVNPLDIRIVDQDKGYVFSRFLIDRGHEYSLRGQIIPPARIVFAPFTQSQQQKLSDIYLQMREGGNLHIALLQGSKNKPRVYSVPLEGFFDLSDKILKDCSYLNSKVQNYKGEVSLLPDYLSREPDGYAPPDFSLKPRLPSDGLTPYKEPVAAEPPKEDLLEALKKNTDKEEDELPPKVEVFSPGGARASIGDDGKPITSSQEQASDEQKNGSSQSMGTAKPMNIGDDGKPL
ncbi:MAG: hypothetical protein ACI4UM_06350 [Succinivibrio sp.]